MNFDRRTLLGSAVVVGLALFVVVGGGLTLATTVNDAPASGDNDGDEPSPGNVTLSEQDAIDVATGDVDGTVGEVELETEDGTPVYEVTVEASNGSVTELAVHANDGTIVEIESESEDEGDEGEGEERDESDDESDDEEDENEEEDERDDEEDENESDDDEAEEEAESVAPGNVSLSEQDAIDVATGEVDGTVGEVELETEDGTPVYEITVERDTGSIVEISVHANDGTVLEVETEDGDDGTGETGG